MRKMNVAGLILCFGVSIFTLIIMGNYIALSPFAALLFMIGLTLLGVDRWAGEARYGLLIIAVLWAIFWGFIAGGSFTIAAFAALGVSFGHGEARHAAAWYMFGYFGFTIIFGVLGVANVIRFFVGLFSLPKLGSQNVSS